MASTSFNWHASLMHTYEELAKQIVAIAPQFLGAIALLVAGWIIANLLRVASKKLIEGFDTVFRRAAKTNAMKQEKIKRSYAAIISKLVFWTIMLFFIAAVGNLLGWKMFSGWMESIINHLPNLITGFLIILIGFLLGNGMRTVIISTADSAGIEQSEILGRSIQILVLLITMIIGAGQIGINVGLLSDILIVILGVLLAGVGLAFGLGAKTLIANIIGAQYIRKHCRIGEEMQIGEVCGVIAEVTQTAIVLDIDNGRSVVPAKEFQEHITTFSASGVETDSK